MGHPYLSLATNILTANFTRLDFPYKLTFCLTYWCNYRCKTCNIWQKRPKDELSLEEIQRFFRTSTRFSWIDLTGGEVFLRKDFAQICETILSECKDLILLHFPTNGYLTDRIVSDVHKIMACRPESLIITISMDGDEALNDEIRGIPGGWRKQIETFKQLYHIPGVRVVLGMTLSAYNADKFDATFAAAKRECPWLDYEDFHVNIVHTSGHYFSNTDLNLNSFDQETLVQTVRKYIHLRGVPTTPVAFLEREYLKRVEQYVRTGHTPMRCHALKSSCFIDSWGNVYPCSIYDRRLGSLRDYDYDLRAIWRSDAAVKLQQEIWQYQCPHCWTPCEAYQSILGNLLRPRAKKACSAVDRLPALKPLTSDRL